MLVFDAEQLRFRELDKDEIIWRTIRGNKVPLPKHGSREEKARAIKEWFASKKKELPESKGRVGFYSAKVEHEQPKKAARGTGEKAQVHGEGQYTLKYAENNYENYFKKFQHTKSLVSSMSIEEKQKLHGWYSNLFGGMNSVKSLPGKIDKEISRWEKDIEDLKAHRAKYRGITEMSKESAEALLNNPDEMRKYGVPESITDYNELWRWAGRETGSDIDYIRQKEKNIENAKDAKRQLERLIAEGKIWEEPGVYTAGGKIYEKDTGKKTTQAGVHYSIINNIYRMKSDEEREKYKADQIEHYKNQIASLQQKIKDLKPNDWEYSWKSQYEKDIRSIEREISWLEKLDIKDIKAAKAQMSKVRLPASKTYLREATGLRRQSPYVKEGIKNTLIDSYGVNELRDLGLNDIADEFESIVDDAIGLNNNHSSPQHISNMLEDMPDKLGSGFKQNLILGHTFGQKPEEFEKNSTPWGKREENIRMNKAMYLVKEIADRLRYTLLAKNKIDELVINNGRGIYNKLGRFLANAKTKSYWGASERQGQLAATKALSKHGINGIAYTGHGVSRVSGYTDSEGNVTFDPENKIEVLEKTTDPDVIKSWIERQRELIGKKKKSPVLDADDDIIEWITVKGNHIPIKKGQSKEDAINNFLERQKAEKGKEKHESLQKKYSEQAESAKAEALKLQKQFESLWVSYEDFKNNPKMQEIAKERDKVLEQMLKSRNLQARAEKNIKKYQDMLNRLDNAENSFKDSGVADIVNFGNLPHEQAKEAVSVLKNLQNKYGFMKGKLEFVGSYETQEFKDWYKNLVVEAEILNNYARIMTGVENAYNKVREWENMSDELKNELKKDQWEVVRYEGAKKTVADFEKLGEDEYVRHWVETHYRTTKRFTNNIWAYYLVGKDSKDRGAIVFNSQNYDSHGEELGSFHPVGCNTKKSVLDHEFGHSIYFALELDKPFANGEDEPLGKLRNFIVSEYRKERDYIRKNLSGYAATNLSEFFAEAFAEYENNPNPRNIAKTVGEYLQQYMTELKDGTHQKRIDDKVAKI